MKETTNPERLVSVPFSKTECNVDFYINTGTDKDICGVLTEYKVFKTDFFEFSFSTRQTVILFLILEELTCGTEWCCSCLHTKSKNGM